MNATNSLSHSLDSSHDLVSSKRSKSVTSRSCKQTCQPDPQQTEVVWSAGAPEWLMDIKAGSRAPGSLVVSQWWDYFSCRIKILLLFGDLRPNQVSSLGKSWFPFVELKNLEASWPCCLSCPWHWFRSEWPPCGSLWWGERELTTYLMVFTFCSRLNSVPQKLVHTPLEPVNVTSFVNSVFADVIK